MPQVTQQVPESTPVPTAALPAKKETFPDWLIRSQVSYLSPTPFDVSETMSEACESLQLFSKQTSKGFSTHLCSWVYECQFSPLLVQAIKKNQLDHANLEFLASKSHEYKTSFQSLYFMLKYKKTDYFILLTSSFSVLFSDVVRVYPKSVIDGKLKENEIEFTIQDDCLVSDDVHGVYDVLLNWQDRKSGQTLLFSPSPFLNATLKKAKLQFNEQLGDLYKITFQGWILPEAFKSLSLHFSTKCNYNVHLNSTTIKRQAIEETE